MGLWAEERRTRTVELLLTMPVSMWQTVMGKFLAGWTFIALGVVLTFPIVLTTCHLGNPDLGAVLCGYIGSILLAGAYVSVGMLSSSLTRSQVVAFVVGLVTCLLFLIAGWPPVTNFFVRWAPAWLVETVAAFSFMPHFESLQRGVIDLRDVSYYVSVIVFMIAGTHVVLDNRKYA
jgi:ABC-2 type transport system permease protein